MKRLFSSKGQAALEYLLTYGWALVVIVLVIGALVALNVFNLGGTNETCGGLPSLLAYNTHVYRADGNFAISLINGTGKDINVTMLQVAGTDKNLAAGVISKTGETMLVNAVGFPVGTSGNSYKSTVQLTYTYTGISGFSGLKASGTCLGKFQ